MSSNPESILDSVKKALGLDSEFTAFDLDITMFINSAFGSLTQLGVGSDTSFIIADDTTLWSQYVTDLSYLAMVKQFIIMSVRLAFDPPATSFGLDAIKDQITQLSWRLVVAVETVNPPSDPGGSWGSPSSFTEDGVLKTYFAPKSVQLDFASTVTIDASKGNVFYLMMSADCIIDAPINGADAEHITLELTSAGFAATWGSGWNFGAAGTPSLSPDNTDIISAVYRQDAAEWWAGFTPGF
jgi:hypothetical protein